MAFTLPLRLLLFKGVSGGLGLRVSCLLGDLLKFSLLHSLLEFLRFTDLSLPLPKLAHLPFTCLRLNPQLLQPRLLLPLRIKFNLPKPGLLIPLQRILGLPSLLHDLRQPLLLSLHHFLDFPPPLRLLITACGLSFRLFLRLFFFACFLVCQVFSFLDFLFFLCLLDLDLLAFLFFDESLLVDPFLLRQSFPLQRCLLSYLFLFSIKDSLFCSGAGTCFLSAFFFYSSLAQFFSLKFDLVAGPLFNPLQVLCEFDFLQVFLDVAANLVQHGEAYFGAGVQVLDLGQGRQVL